MELCLVDTELADQVMLSSNQVNIIIQDNDALTGELMHEPFQLRFKVSSH